MPVRSDELTDRLLPPAGADTGARPPASSSPPLANRSALSVAGDPAARTAEAERQYLGMELDDPPSEPDHQLLKAIILAALTTLFFIDLKYAPQVNITSLYVVVIFLTLSLRRVRWVLGVTVASLLLNLFAARWNQMYPPLGWSPHMALNHVIMAAGAQVPAGVLAYQAIVTQRRLERNTEQTIRRQRGLYERERAARAAEQDARIREQRASDVLRTQAEELRMLLESEQKARQRAAEAVGQRDHLRILTEKFQRTLLPIVPQELAGGRLKLGSLYQPAIQEMQMGGDFYDAVELPGGFIGLVIGDVAGHGVEAAAQTAFVTTTLRAFATEDPCCPGKVLARVNRSLTIDAHFDVFVSVFYGVYDPATGVLRYTNAGHEPPVLIRADGTIESLDSTGMVVGVDPSITYEEAQTRINPGDCVVMITDGITEARESESGKMLGWPGVAQIAVDRCSDWARGISPTDMTRANRLAEALYQDAIAFVGAPEADSSGGLNDDVALLVVLVSPVPAGAEVEEAPEPEAVLAA